MKKKTGDETRVHTRIFGEMERHLHEHGAPEEVFGFLMQHWTHLLTKIYVSRGNRHPDWLAGWETVNALLWTLAPKQGQMETEKMLRLLPSLLGRLHEGCAALGLSLAERDALFGRLALMHAAVARAGLQQRDSADRSADAAGLEPDDELEMNGVEPPTQEETPLPIFSDASRMPEMKPGDRVRFVVHSDGEIHQKTLTLNWVSPMGGMYMFTNEQGLDALTLTRARLEARFLNGAASLVVTR